METLTKREKRLKVEFCSLCQRLERHAVKPKIEVRGEITWIGPHAAIFKGKKYKHETTPLR